MLTNPPRGAEEQSRRTATFCREIARREGFADPQIAALVDAAAYVQGGNRGDRAKPDTLADRLSRAALGLDVPLTGSESELLEILQMAKDFDGLCISSGVAAKKSLRQVIWDVRSDPLAHPAVGLVVTDIRGVDRSQIYRLIPRLPIFPAIAGKAMRVLEDENASLASILALVSSDPVLAGAVIRDAVKVGRMGMSRNIASIEDAVRWLGTSATAQIILRESLKPLLALEGHNAAWSHAIQVATAAHKLARRLKDINPGEAYLVGLVHDCGSLLLSVADVEAQRLKNRLVAGACPSSIAELLAFDLDHADAGAEVVKSWSFAAEHVEAIRWHHEPEHTEFRLASLLYVLEVATANNEHLHAPERLEKALLLLGTTQAEVAQCIAA